MKLNLFSLVGLVSLFLVTGSAYSADSKVVKSYLDAKDYDSYWGGYYPWSGVHVGYESMDPPGLLRGMAEFDITAGGTKPEGLNLLPKAKVFWELNSPVEFINTDNMVVDVAVYEGDGVVKNADFDETGNQIASFSRPSGTYSDVEVEITSGLRPSMPFIGINASCAIPADPYIFGEMNCSNGGRLRAEDDPYEILKNNPISLRVLYGDQIEADFEPVGSLGPVKLEDLAKSLDIDHFNWIQHVVDQPESWELIRQNEEGTDYEEVPLPWLDPDMHVKNISQMLMYNDDLDVAERFEAAVHDDKPFCWDEPDQVASFTKDFKLSFSDSPRFPNGWFQPGEYVYFETKLVGVKDGKMVSFDDIPCLTFTWKCDLTYEGGQIYTSYYADVPEAISGSIFDVRIAPEPSTFTLLLITVGFFVFGRKRLKH